MSSQPSSLTKNGEVKQRERLYYLDWLRVAAILCVFIIHCGKIFDYNTSVMYNNVRSPAISAFRDSVLIWVMPLFFVLSGAAVALSGMADRPWAFIKSRFSRLVVPLIFVGTFLINAIYVYVERLFAGEAAPGFIAWYPHYFDGIYGFGGNLAPLGQGTHLWYLEFLFIYSLILLPLFARPKRRDASTLARLSKHFQSPLALLALCVPISALSATVELLGLGGIRVMGGWDPISYLFFLAYGYLVFASKSIAPMLKKMGPWCLAAAVLLTAALVDVHFGFVLKVPGLTRHDLLNDGALLPVNAAWMAVFQALRGMAAWCWVIGLLGLGSRVLNTNSKFLSYANRAVLPFYILHHAVIYVVGYYAIRLSAGISAKFALISVTAFMIIMAIYELAIKRIKFVRFLFGMKWRDQ